MLDQTTQSQLGAMIHKTEPHTKRTSQTFLAFLPLFFGLTLNCFAEQTPEISSEAEDSQDVSIALFTGWDSRYYSEGRDALEGDSLLTGSLELEWQSLFAGAWYGYSPDQDYDELQLSLGVANSIGPFDYYLAYTHFRFPFESETDNEVGAGLSVSGLPADLTLSLDSYYSFEATGWFAELSASRAFSVSDQLNLEILGILGFNQGYVSDGSDGLNNFALQLAVEYALTDQVALTAYTAYNWAIDADSTLPGDDALIDFAFSGVGIQWSF